MGHSAARRAGGDLMARRRCPCELDQICTARKIWMCPEDEQPLDIEKIEKIVANSIRLPSEFIQIKNDIEGMRGWI